MVWTSEVTATYQVQVIESTASSGVKLKKTLRLEIVEYTSCARVGTARILRQNGHAQHDVSISYTLTFGANILSNPTRDASAW